MLILCRAGAYGDYQQSAMYVPVSGLYYSQDVQVCNVLIDHANIEFDIEFWSYFTASLDSRSRNCCSASTL